MRISSTSNQHPRIVLAALALAWAVPVLALAQPSAVPQAEQLDVATLKPSYPHRFFVMDSNTDIGVKILNGDTLEIEGLIPAVEASVPALDPAGRYFYVCESIWTRGNRGTRQDLISVYDSRTLNLAAEINLPNGRALANALAHACDVSGDGKYAYVYSMQPASSVSVVNLEQRKVTSTVELPGCALAFPWGDRGFSALCGDGSIASVALSGTGKAGPIEHSAKFFSPDSDPIFAESVVDRQTGRAFLISYTGLIYPAQLGEHSTVDKPWSLQEAAGLPVAGTGMHELAWRPGGLEPIAWHKPTNRLYVLMHPGAHFTERAAGTEVWVVDSGSHKVLNRIALTDPASTLAISQDDKPMLYVLGSDGAIVTYDAETGERRGKAATRGGDFALAVGF
jgi:methylamine dehydrogenase heavy chain